MQLQVMPDLGGEFGWLASSGWTLSRQPYAVCSCYQVNLAAVSPSPNDDTLVPVSPPRPRTLTISIFSQPSARWNHALTTDSQERPSISGLPS